MAKSFYLIRLGTAIVVVVGSLAAAYPQAAEDNCRPFLRTGHYVCDEFLQFYDEWEGLELFGYPLTEAYHDPVLGIKVQYFQYARMEWHPDNADPYKVQLGLLGDELGYDYPSAGADQIPPVNTAKHHYFPETGHVVSFEFLNYFRTKGGIDIFGYPRSEFLMEDGYFVQYFQRARMEWHPGAPAGSSIRLTPIGEIYAREFGINTAPIIIEISGLRVSVSVQYATIADDDTQTVYVYVADQHWNPIKGAYAAGVIHYPSGDQEFVFGFTDEYGFIQHTFDLRSTPPGEKVVVDVQVAYGRLTDSAQTSFFFWW
jgi:hypothetical protein